MDHTTRRGFSATTRDEDRVFPALLKYWRGHRGMSQLDLSLAAEVSARHISFMETARSRPSIEMVLTLAETLDIPLRNRNEMLRAAGFAPVFAEPGIDSLLAGRLGATIDVMLAHHEPLPMIVVDRLYRVVRTNRAATQLLAAVGADPAADDVNLLRLMFTPAVRSLVTNFAEVSADVVRRLQREVLHHPLDAELAELLSDLLADPEITNDWRQADPGVSDEPLMPIDLSLGDAHLSFLTTVTTFNAAHSVTLDELRIESWYPRDDATAQLCAALLT